MPQTPATLMRGGSSKCWIFDGRDLPADRERLAKLLVETFGAADPHQLDGVGGRTSVTSNAALVSPSADADVDLDYLFAQVAVGEGIVEWGSNCGNCATAVALWSVQEFGLDCGGPTTTVRMRNVNTGTDVIAEVDTSGGVPSISVPGVHGMGTGVDLTFRDPAGSTTGTLWPAHSHRSRLSVDGVSMTVSMVDAGAPIVIIDAESLGICAAATEAQVIQHVPMLRRVRAHAAVEMGMAASVEESFDAVPKVVVVGPPRDYTTTLGEDVCADDYDVSVRMLSMNAPHPTIGLTTAVAVALASTVTDSVLGEVGVCETRPVSDGDHASLQVRTLTLGTLGGLLRCEVRTRGDHSEVLLRRAARRLAEAQLYLR